MRIAQVAPLTEAVPPKFYGGTERVVHWITEELVALGNDVTLFATGDSRTSVADGLAATAKVITAAAAIMVVVFGSFMLESDRVLKLMGTGLAAAILLDATIVRMLLVPATMELLGDRNWWLPRWLDRILPNLDVEGTATPLPEVEREEEERPEDREPEPAGARAD